MPGPEVGETTGFWVVNLPTLPGHLWPFVNSTTVSELSMVRSDQT